MKASFCAAVRPSASRAVAAFEVCSKSAAETKGSGPVVRPIPAREHRDFRRVVIDRSLIHRSFKILFWFTRALARERPPHSQPAGARMQLTPALDSPVGQESSPSSSGSKALDVVKLKNLALRLEPVAGGARLHLRPAIAARARFHQVDSTRVSGKGLLSPPRAVPVAGWMMSSGCSASQPSATAHDRPVRIWRFQGHCFGSLRPQGFATAGQLLSRAQYVEPKQIMFIAVRLLLRLRTARARHLVRDGARVNRRRAALLQR